MPMMLANFEVYVKDNHGWKEGRDLPTVTCKTCTTAIRKNSAGKYNLSVCPDCMTAVHNTHACVKDVDGEGRFVCHKCYDKFAKQVRLPRTAIARAIVSPKRPEDLPPCSK